LNSKFEEKTPNSKFKLEPIQGQNQFYLRTSKHVTVNSMHLKSIFLPPKVESNINQSL